MSKTIPKKMPRKTKRSFPLPNDARLDAQPWHGNKLRPFLAAYLDDSNPDTFLNKTTSAMAAGYKCDTVENFSSMGNKAWRRCRDLIDKWLDEAGLSDTALKIKLFSLLEGESIKLQTIRGRPKNLKPNVTVLAETEGETIITEEGTTTKEGETLLAVKLKDLELQRRTLDMALRHKGMYAPETRDTKVLIWISPARESQGKVIDVTLLPQDHGDQGEDQEEDQED